MNPIKIALIAPIVNDISDVVNYDTMMAYNILTRLRKCNAIEIVAEVDPKADLVNVNWNGATHIFAIVLRYWHKQNVRVINNLASKIRGKLFHYYDSGHYPIKHPAVINFAVMDWTITKGRDVHIGWAADASSFHIDKTRNDDILRVLIDHPPYKIQASAIRDLNAIVQNKALLNELNKKCGTRFNRAVIRRLVSDGIDESTITSINCTYNRKSLSQPELINEYAKAHVYFMMHRESMGMPVLEGALAGCVIAAPHKLVKDEVLKHVNHVKFESRINWSAIISKINPQDNRKRVEDYTWDKCIDNVVSGFRQYQK